MKHSLLYRTIMISALCLTLSAARAQYVAIPDTNVGNWLLNNGYATCITGNSTSGFHLDTACGLLSADTVIIRYDNIHDLTGIQYFRNMTYLDCSDNHITTFAPLLPFSSSLTTLICSNNPLGSLPTLPSALYYLNCDSDHLASLPTLPATLWWLTCDSNYLTSLPALPAPLYTLSCQWNRLTTIPATSGTSLVNFNASYNQITSISPLASSISNFYVSFNRLTSLPALPTSLFQANVSYNSLTSLPALPASLSTLYCDFNQLTSLPALPAGMFNLICSWNHITSLPALPASLFSIDCDNNPITILPALPAGLNQLIAYSDSLTSLPTLPPSLNYLNCASNQLTSLPPLPQTVASVVCANNTGLSCLPRIYHNQLFQFYIANTAITCIPNTFSAQLYDVNPDTMPLCTPATGCDFYYNIAGNVHADTASTCQNDSLFPGSPITDLKVQLLLNGQVVQQFYTFNSGGYSFDVSNYTDYTVSVDTTLLPLTVVCPASDTQYVALTAQDTVATQVNFGMQCSNFDYGVGYIWGQHFRPTGTTQVHIGAGNIARILHSIDCGANMPGTVTTTLAGSITYVGPAPGALTPTSVSGNTLTYTLPNLDTLTWSLYDSFGSGSLDIIVLVDTGAVAGTNACFTTTITPATPDMNAADNTLTACFTIVHSWDPNTKTVTPTVLDENADWLTYNVEFQNTGTDTAYTVVVRDTLSQYVNASTFEYVASSNKAVIQLFGSDMVFTFPHINLPDSTVNPTRSIGWIQYKVKSKPNLPNGTQITNTAYIYFDHNPAVATNTVVSTVRACSDTTILLSHAICQGDTFTFAGHPLTVANNYTDTVPRTGGCDSIIQLTLTVNPLPTVTFTWDSIVQEQYLALESPSVAGWCSLFFPRLIVPLVGGMPPGGVYSGDLVTNDTLNLTHFQWTPFYVDSVFYTYTDNNNCSATVLDSVIALDCDGIQSISESSISLYPNPNKGLFTLETSDCIGREYTISDMLGTVIEQKVISSATQTIEITDAAEGVYTLVVKGALPVRFVVLR